MGKKGLESLRSGCVDNGEAANSGGDPVTVRAAESGNVEDRGGDPVVMGMAAGGSVLYPVGLWQDTGHMH